ncbi:hypothetical protein IJC60_02825 [bacterium]|nr:hypothetical protein [bacterium]
MKKKLNWLKNILICFGALALCGCSALQYSGADFDKVNQKNITTNESFYFKAYKKQLNENIEMKIGVTKTQIPDILVVYVDVQNNGEYPYSLNIEDFVIKLGGKTAHFIKPSDYVAQYQDMENQLLAASQGIAPTLNSVATIANHYQRDTRQLAMAENTDMEVSLQQIAAIAGGIESHALRSISQVPAKAKKYYYLFIEDIELYPLEITYQNLKYTFDAK